MQLMNKVVFVTGGARGIGHACAEAVLQRGAKVAIADTDTDKGLKETDKLKAEFGQDKVFFIRCDVANEEDFKEAFSEVVELFGNIDVIINNAGIVDEIRWERTLDVNLKGVIIGTEIANAHMRRDKGGRGGIIINMSSILGYTYVFTVPIYTASKHGVIGYTRSLASAPDVSCQGIRYACVCPNVVDTAVADTVKLKCRQEYIEKVKELLPEELLSVSQVADAVMSLIDDDNSNDAVLEVNVEQGFIRKKLVAEQA